MGSRVRQTAGMAARACLIVIVTSGLLGACHSSPTAPGSVEGTYRLTELNGQAIPYDHVIGCCIYTAGSLALQSGRYEASITFRNKNNQGVFTVGEQGTYTLAGTSIEFRPTRADFPFSLYGARLEGSAIRVSLGGDGPGAADQLRALFQK